LLQDVRSGTGACLTPRYVQLVTIVHLLGGPECALSR
jgi:hypothetical protein